MKSALLLLSVGIVLVEASSVPDWIYFGRGLNRSEIKKLRQRCDSSSSEESDLSAPSRSKPTTEESTQRSSTNHPSTISPHSVDPTTLESTSKIAKVSNGTLGNTIPPLHRRLPEKPASTTNEPTSETESTNDRTRSTSRSTEPISTKEAPVLIRARPETPVSESETTSTTQESEVTQEIVKSTFATEPNNPTHLKPDLAMILKKLFKGTNNL